MNKTYIKRQLTLSKLGFTINENIQAYIDLFDEIIGDHNRLTKHKAILHKRYEGYLYSKNDDRLLFYDYKNEEFSVSYDIWKEIEQKSHLKDKEINILLTAILEEYFNYNVNVTYEDYFMDMNSSINIIN